MSKRGDAVGRWRCIVQQQATSGLSVAAFCRQSQIAPASFYLWRRKLRDGANRAASDAATFTEVRIAPASRGGSASSDDAGALELHLPHGLRITVRRRFDCQTLLDLLATLELYAAEVTTLDRKTDDAIAQGTESSPPSTSCHTPGGTSDAATPEAAV